MEGVVDQLQAEMEDVQCCPEVMEEVVDQLQWKK